METELKLLLAPQHAKALAKHLLLKRHALAAPRVKDQTGVYFDTPDNDFRRNDAGLRVRRTGDEYIQTLKAGGGVQGGLHQRNEWESPVPGQQPDLALLRTLVPADMPWASALLGKDAAARIEPIFATQIKRTIWDLAMPDGSEIEFVLDIGHIIYGKHAVEVCEIELELKTGNALSLFDVALELLNDIPLQIGIQSKAQRGYALYWHATLPPEAIAENAQRAKPLQLSKKMSVEQAFLAIVGNCIEQIQANNIADGDPQDVERLHQMRVGLRRLRSAFSLFEDVIALPDDLHDGFSWLADAVGEARDWDVLANTTLATPTLAIAEGADIEAVRAAAQREAATAHMAAVDAVSSVRHTALMLHFGRWLMAQPWRTDANQHKALAMPLVRFAHDTLRQDQKRLRKRGRHMEDNVQSRHRTRIAAKRMRYDVEFFAALYAEKRSKPYIKALTKLQDTLGLLNDQAVGDALLVRLARRHTKLAGAVGFARGYLAARSTAGEDKLQRLWRKWKAQEIPG